MKVYALLIYSFSRYQNDNKSFICVLINESQVHVRQREMEIEWDRSIFLIL